MLILNLSKLLCKPSCVCSMIQGLTTVKVSYGHCVYLITFLECLLWHLIFLEWAVISFIQQGPDLFPSLWTHFYRYMLNSAVSRWSDLYASYKVAWGSVTLNLTLVWFSKVFANGSSFFCCLKLYDWQLKIWEATGWPCWLWDITLVWEMLLILTVGCLYPTSDFML